MAVRVINTMASAHVGHGVPQLRQEVAGHEEAGDLGEDLGWCRHRQVGHEASGDRDLPSDQDGCDSGAPEAPPDALP